ncbi:HesA/MoeB/ThiF family protein [Rhizobium laguerreae]|uniref:HesA/MoeB/ThiF family protein n=1 Tax=Rhizobium laguerreae TaxID=1076926 RepID=UPI001C9203D9|nr:HesA/MoeB/ThiF family protein [Rhizobium laguerreae]MBY3203466.1 HesA/MoeB/ThiF family protein [Rhizobium laguerreae]
MTGRHTRLRKYLGENALETLESKFVVLVGCGALGSAAASLLVRAGVGRLRIIDFDVVHETNLGDQCLYSDEAAAQLSQKVDAAAAQLALFNPNVIIEPVAAMLDRDNALELCAGAHVIVDGTDNLEAKYLINDVAVKTNTPWIYGGCVGGHGSVLAVIPHQTACLRCIWPAPPPLSNAATCSAIGLLPTSPAFAAALQVTEALKILLGRGDEVLEGPLLMDLWQGTIRFQAGHGGRRHDCPACANAGFEFLEGSGDAVGGSQWSPSIGM